MSKKLTTVIAEIKQDDKGLDDNINFYAAKYSKTELEDNTLIGKKKFKYKSERNITTEIV